MKITKGLLSVAVVVALLLAGNAGHCATLTAGTKIQLCKSGDGPWDRGLERAPDGSALWVPRGLAVDNDGRIYVPDPLRDRIFVFAPEGQPWKVIESEQFYEPSDVKVSEDNTLLVTAWVKEKGEPVQLVASYNGTDWQFELVKSAEPVGHEYEEFARMYRIHDIGRVVPFGKDGLRYLGWTARWDRDLQLVDKDGRHVKSVPGKFFDQKGRYYKRVKNETARVELGENAFAIVDESGNLLGKFTARGNLLLKFKGWIYVMDHSENKWSLLRRYGEDGSVEHEIRLVNDEILGLPLISPNGEHFFLAWSGTDGVSVTRLTYREDQGQ